MNIAAVMAAMKVDGLSRSAKNALVAVACRADRHTGIAAVSVGRVAKDVGVSYKTAWLALNELVNSGYLIVDKSPGRASEWMLTPVMVTDPPMSSTTPTYVAVTEDLCHPQRGKESLEKSKERAVGRSPRTATDDAGEKPRLSLVTGQPERPDWTAHLPNWTQERMKRDHLEP